MNILAIDPAIKTGWATKKVSGTADFSTRSSESKGLRLVRFRKHFKEVIQSMEIDIVVYEKPSGRHFNALRSHSNFEGVLIDLCESLNVMYKDYSPSEIKKYATGKGNANKAKMVEAAKKKFTCHIVDDNHADALWLLELAKEDLI